MTRTDWSVFVVFLPLLLVVGCGPIPERELSDTTTDYAMLPNGNDPMNPGQSKYVIAGHLSNDGENLVRVMEQAKGRPLNVLSLSGGGQNGAFGAGFLVGWREAGTRPEFDAVGGVSTGALLATHALLGTPEDDATLEEMYTTVTQDDIYKRRSVFALLKSDSLMDTTPLKEMVARYITAETLERVAAAFEEGRFIAVGTTNIDYEQTWIWNMSLIAKNGDLDLYRKVLLASASFPIVFPPVEIDGHLFVDGAARSNLVVPGLAGEEPPGSPLHGPGNIFIIDNGKLSNPPEALRRAIGDVAATTLATMMAQSMQTAIFRTYVGARALGYNYKLVAIESGVAIGKDPLAFDPQQMRAAFDAGRALAKEPDPWQTEPPANDDIPSWATELLTLPE